MLKYKHSIQLYKNFNERNQNETWMNLNFQLDFGTRNEHVHLFDSSRKKIGRLAALLERVGLLFNISSVKIQSFILFTGEKCYKLGKCRQQ